MKRKLSDTLNKQKAALYIRVSTHWQIDKDSLPLQREDLTNYTKYALGIDSYEIFEDAGYSAKNTDRPAYQQMMARMRTGEFTHLVVWKIDRISRNLLDFAAMYDEIKKLGVTFVSKNEQFDTSSAMGEAMLKIILVFAELERNMTSERVSAVMLSRAGNGLWNGGKIPYGYDYNEETGVFSINKNEAEIVRFMYNYYEQERSLLKVAKNLNERGIPTRKGNTWSPVTVSIILKSPFYIGTMRYNYLKESKRTNVKPESEWILIEDHHPAIIEKEQWIRVSEYLSENQRNRKNSSKTYSRKNIHIFAGLLKCGYCGSGMPSTVDRARSDGWRPSIYSCSRKRRFNDCPNKYISDITLGPFVLNYIANMMKAQRSFGKTTSIEVLEKKLLRGDTFSDVEHIDRPGLEELYNSLRAGKTTSVDYVTPAVSSDIYSSGEDRERDLLVSEKRKKERALARLKSLYLYDEEAISEKDYLVEQKKLKDSIKEIDKRLEEIEKNSSLHFTLSDEEFMAKASYFIMSQQLTDKRHIDYEKFIRKIDPKIIKDFLNSIVQNFCIKNGKIVSIRFKNGLEHRFLYKSEE